MDGADKKEEEFWLSLGIALRALRKANRLKQADLVRIGINRTTLANIESGRQRVNFYRLLKLADLYGVDVQALAKPDPASAKLREAKKINEDIKKKMAELRKLRFKKKVLGLPVR